MNKYFGKLWLIMRHGPFIIYWIFYDYLLTIWVQLKKIDYIGVYVKILSNSERKFWFDPEDVGRGYNALTIIKIGLDTEWFSIDAVCGLISHEVLHQILWRRINPEAYKKLDNIHSFHGVKVKFIG